MITVRENTLSAIAKLAQRAAWHDALAIVEQQAARYGELAATSAKSAAHEIRQRIEELERDAA